jgi:transposase
MGDRTREATRPEGMLGDASIKLSVVASSLTTVSAGAMLAALIDGERDARVLADLAKGKLRAKIPEMTEALIGHFDDGHAQLARSILGRLDVVEADLAALDAVITTACRPWAHQIQLPQTIPGVGEKIAQVILAETGVTCPASRRRRTWPPGPGSRRRSTSRPANAPPLERGTATSG